MENYIQEAANEIPNMVFEVFDEKGHFTETDMGTKEFPELLTETLK